MEKRGLARLLPRFSTPASGSPDRARNHIPPVKTRHNGLQRIADGEKCTSRRGTHVPQHGTVTYGPLSEENRLFVARSITFCGADWMGLTYLPVCRPFFRPFPNFRRLRFRLSAARLRSALSHASHSRANKSSKRKSNALSRASSTPTRRTNVSQCGTHLTVQRGQWAGQSM